MRMIRAFTNEDEGVCCCFWEAASRDDLQTLFDGTGVPFESMIEVREYSPATA
jgi:hypothetical protein